MNKKLLLLFMILSLLTIESFAQVSGTTVKGRKPDGSFDWIQLDNTGNLKSSVTGINATFSAELIPNDFQYIHASTNTIPQTYTTPAGTVGISIQVLTAGKTLKWMLATNTMNISQGELVNWYAEEKVEAGVPLAVISSDTVTQYVLKFKRKL